MIPALKARIDALFYNPEMENIVTSLMEEFGRSRKMDEASLFAKVMQLNAGEQKSLKYWIDVVTSYPVQLQEGLRWIAKSYEASATVGNGTKLKQQDEASSSFQMPGFSEQKFIEVFPKQSNQFIQFRKRLMGTPKRDKTSASADNMTKLKQQDEASSSSQKVGLPEKEFMEVSTSTLPLVNRIPMLKDMVSQLWEKINQP